MGVVIPFWNCCAHFIWNNIFNQRLTKKFNMRNYDKGNLGLAATLLAVQQVVSAWHTRKTPPPALPLRTPICHIRFTPSFRADKGPSTENAVPYTARAVSEFLGNTLATARGHYAKRNAHPVVRLALLMLELKEKGIIDAQQIEHICTNRQGYDLTTLHAAAVQLNQQRS
jgi:hypothetical protein